MVIALVSSSCSGYRGTGGWGMDTCTIHVCVAWHMLVHFCSCPQSQLATLCATTGQVGVKMTVCVCVCVPVQPLIGGGGGGGDMIIMNDREHLWADTHCMWGGLWESLCASRLTCDVIGRNHTLK